MTEVASFEEQRPQDPTVDIRRRREDALLEFRKQMTDEERGARRRAQRWSWLSPLLSLVAASGSGFAGFAVATNDLSGGWREAVIIVAFVSTGVGAGAASIRPTEHAEEARRAVANAVALIGWVDILLFELTKLPEEEFWFRVRALKAWGMHQMGVEAYTYDGSTPWSSYGPTPELANPQESG